MNAGLIGCGTIGRFLLESINRKGLVPGCRISAAFDARPNDFDKLKRRYGMQVYTNVEAMLASDIDFVIEAANVAVVRQYARLIVEAGIDMIIISVGALVDRAFYEQLFAACRTGGAQIHLPSGAIGGLDVLKAAAAAGELESVSLVTRKPASSLVDEPLESEKIVFEGYAEQAIEQFPKNINVSITLSLVGLGPQKTKVTMIADPRATRNSHAIEARGAFGKLSIQLENAPMPSNPKTSYLAALSVLSALSNQNQRIHIG